ncbi:MAG: AAA family ATPase [archaeon]|nr:AAA family ATPase [archaeon]
MASQEEEYVPVYVMAGGTLGSMRRLLRSNSDSGYAKVNADSISLLIELFREKDPIIKLEGNVLRGYYVPTRSLSIMFLIHTIALGGSGMLAANRGEIVKKDMQNRFGIEPEKIKDLESIFTGDMKRFLIPAALLLGLDATVTDIIPLLSRDYKRNKQVEKIEEELLGGRTLPELAYEDDLRHVLLHLFEASSGVQELWVMLPILHQAVNDCEEGEQVFVFIDEPEAHLHPPAQVKFGEWFVNTCQNYENINFILSTHSDILLGAIARKSARDESLELIRVYGFDMDENGSVTVERKEIYSGGEVKGIKGFSEAIESITWL